MPPLPYLGSLSLMARNLASTQKTGDQTTIKPCWRKKSFAFFASFYKLSGGFVTFSKQ